MRGGSGEGIAEPSGTAWVASLRLVATFGALATVSTVAPLLTPVSVPLWPLAFVVGVFVLRRRFSRTEQRRACLSLAAVASVVLVAELLVAPSYLQQTYLGWCVAAQLVIAMLLGGLAYAGARIDAIVEHLVPRRA